jgi:dihydrofolate reductase
MKLEWENSTQLSGDAVEAVRKLKQEDGPDLQVHGSGDFIQTLFKNDLADELWLKIFPVTLGGGKRLFGEGTSPGAFKVVKSTTSPSGVIVASYQRDGDVKTGSFA